MGPNTTSDQIRGLSDNKIPVAPMKRNPRKEAMWRIVISNLLTTGEMLFDSKSRRDEDAAVVAKVLSMLNVDFNLKFNEYLDEIYGPVRMSESTGQMMVDILATSFGSKQKMREALLSMLDKSE